MSNFSTKQYFKNTLRPVWYAVLCFIIMLFLPIKWPEGARASELFSASLSFGAILVGFIGTAMAMILSLNNRLMVIIKKNGYIRDIMDSFGLCLFLAILFSVVNVIGFMDVKYWCWELWSAIGIAMLWSFKVIFSALFKLIAVQK